MENYMIAIALIGLLVVSGYCTVQLMSGNNPAEDYKLYKQASKINPSCADWCADLALEGKEYEQDSRDCLVRVVERGHCRK